VIKQPASLALWRDIRHKAFHRPTTDSGSRPLGNRLERVEGGAHLFRKLGRAARLCSKIDWGMTGTTIEPFWSSSIEALACDRLAAMAVSWLEISATRG
jgi:hypothetical protein